MSRINFALEDLQAFVATAEKGSFRVAAEALHISQPALSRRIDKLEKTLGSRLLERTTRRVEMTHVGRQFLEEGKRGRPWIFSTAPCSALVTKPRSGAGW